MNRDNDILLTAHQLTVGYKEGKKQLPILKNVNVTLKRGELVCLMGQNGIGKSTLLRTLSAVQPPLSGEVLIEGKNIHSLSRTDRAKKISLVLTERLNAGDLSVEEIVAMGRYPFMGLDVRLSKIDQGRISEAINQAGISELLHQKIHKLSDGQLQKVMIARALSQDGDIILLDEPTAHLDLNNRVAIIRLLKSLARNTKKVILMATHELDLALQIADRLLLVNENGNLIDGIPEDLVLGGILDVVFSLKGYNLKTGQYQHEEGILGQVELIGEGYGYLWTKNALERTGYQVLENAEVKIKIDYTEDNLLWKIVIGGEKKEVRSIKELLSKL